jgi:serine/threonine protein kinase
LSAELVAGRYRIERTLGGGAAAFVDLAHDVELGRPVALKRLAESLARDDDIRARFLREGRLAARVSHPNVVRVYDVGEDDDVPFIAMEFVDGETLAELAVRRGPLPPDEVAGLGIQICRGLAAVHAVGLVHRDVKPQNLLLARSGQLKLGDFGIALGLDATRLTAAGTVLGTAAYLAPEQARGENVTASADLYGAGAVLYELLAGRPARTPSSLAQLAVPVAVDPPPHAPPLLAGLVLRCLAPDPAARPASAAVLARELAATLPEGETLPLPAPAAQAATAIREPPPRRPSRARTLLAGAAAVVIAGGVAAAVATSGGGTKPKPPPPASIPPVQPGASAADEARNLAAWLRRYSR